MKLRSASRKHTASEVNEEKLNQYPIRKTIKKKTCRKKIFIPKFYIHDDHSCMSNAVMNYFGKKFYESREDFVAKQAISLKKSFKSTKDQWSSLATNYVFDPEQNKMFKRKQIYKSMIGNNIFLYNVRKFLNGLSDGHYLIDYTYQGKYRQGHLVAISKMNGIIKTISDKSFENERGLLTFTQIDLNQEANIDTDMVRIDKLKPVFVYSLQIYEYEECELNK